MRSRFAPSFGPGKLLVTFGALASLLGTVREAQACSPPLTPLVTLTSESVPVDGVVAGTFASDTGTTDDIVVVDDQGNEVAGTFETTNPELDASLGLFAWRASSPLTVGATYRVRSKDNLAWFDSPAFQATAAGGDAPTASAKLERYTSGGANPISCEETEP